MAAGIKTILLGEEVGYDEKEREWVNEKGIVRRDEKW